MSIHAALHHVTHYRYDRPVQLGPQLIRLRPAPHCRSHVVSYALKVEPADHFINWQQDPFANYLARIVYPAPVTEFKVTVDLVVEMAVYNPFDFFLEPQAETFPFSYSAEQADELAPYRVTEPATPRLQAYLDCIDRSPQRTIDFLVQLNQRVQQDVRYLIRMEPGVQTPEDTLAKASGSCRDSAWLLVQVLRHLGLAARFVSGYLIQLAPDVKALDGPSGTEVDFTDLHAWCEVYLPGAGWIGLDATSGLLAGEGHIPLACTPQPSSAAPIEGLMDEAEVSFGHEMQVTRVYESPRVTKPYAEHQWADILALGDTVDRSLDAGDVRLTMGGEPTFVATSDRDAPEWNTDALGPTKRGYASELADRLRHAYGQGGFLHAGQGKWYPGEQLPRWALSIYWRADGEPIWRNPARLADEREPMHYTSDDAARFTRKLAETVGVSPDFVQAAYEDVYYYLWRERRLPVNVDPFDARLDDELERARLRRVFTQQLGSAIGYVLPLEPAKPNPALDGPHWRSGSWFLRDDRLYLVPGDSPMGYRLPLDSQPWVSEADYPFLEERDPLAPVGRLPAAAALHARYASARPREQAELPQAGVPAQAARLRLQRPGDVVQSVQPAQPALHQSAAGITRTALCVEARDPRRANGPAAERVGQASSALYVFMPPLALLEDYLDLLAAVEATAEALDVRVVLEGYPPPRDARLQVLQVTPDPGVIEVNIHPARNWREVVAHTEFLYEAAHQTRLCAEKFMTDGRHTGTGGGNHFVMGGATPADSPFLRRPDVLGSLLLYWHNHPSLSYLFSGLFIGPTSQAPRVDEARNDQVYELEIALQELDRHLRHHGSAMPPSLVDRTFRNILVDVTGNTHRSEFSIDKLASPDGPAGRLGLLELRAFEMPPHARMSVVQQLLLRALIARFWQTPYRAPATRWGTALHDRWLLPSFVQQDIADVLAELRQVGFAFQDEWFAPHLEFRFPSVGRIDAMGMSLALRHALEPWHVMGEEGSVGGTVRYVDSSLERLEVRVTGLNDSRYTVTVNGRPLPLQPTGVTGEFVAGVRYKAWNPTSSLHPSIDPHAPLTFDLVDTWMRRSVAGCQYHVAHPGGRNYTTFPVNAYEAESRRLARFFAMGHTGGTMPTPPANLALVGSREFPFTMDLRRQ
ncbi:IMP dehydrogenase [Comamonas serinivorans]|uniref:IMP dehydrogenase n=1 Tax=Comamonas serinivorans TaxID=1082851 RepID=A0A1Y0EQI6_9BURK|nr:transglutaminase family protein [Comamonas serinivorans]ARU05768.1 IMP dehydrogenase [Comamonas serinivorans]